MGGITQQPGGKILASSFKKGLWLTGSCIQRKKTPVNTTSQNAPLRNPYTLYVKMAIDIRRGVR